MGNEKNSFMFRRKGEYLEKYLLYKIYQDYSESLLCIFITIFGQSMP